MIRSFASVLALGLVALAAPPPAHAAHHEPVIQVYLVNVMPGKLDEYRAAVGKLSGVLQRVGSAAAVRMWRTTVGGPNTGTVMVGVEFPNEAAWAAAQPKIEADPEWQKIMAGLPAIRTLVSSGIWRDISPAASTQGPGRVLLVTGVQVKPGMLEEYRKRVGSMEGIQQRLGLSGRVRMWHATLAGPDTGNVAVGVEYADLSTYVADQAKLAGDAEWNELLESLGEIRSLATRSLYQEITP